MQQEKRQSEMQQVERKGKPNLKKQEGSLHTGQAQEIEAQGTVGNHGALRRMGGGVIQAKLKVSQPGDKYEQEADRVAEEVVQLKDRDKMNQPIREKISSIDSSESNLSEKHGMVADDIEKGTQSIKGGGQLLPMKTLNEMSLAFDTDLSAVKVHTGKDAEELNDTLQARAFTEGDDIYFNRGEFQPETLKGRKLLGHELSHVMQQRPSHSNNIIQLQDSENESREEAEKNYRLKQQDWENSLLVLPYQIAMWQTENWIEILAYIRDKEGVNYASSFIEGVLHHAGVKLPSFPAEKGTEKLVEMFLGEGAKITGFILGGIAGLIVGAMVETFIDQVVTHGEEIKKAKIEAKAILEFKDTLRGKFSNIAEAAKTKSKNYLDMANKLRWDCLEQSLTTPQLRSAIEAFELGEMNNKVNIEMFYSGMGLSQTIIHDWALENATNAREPNEGINPELWKEANKKYVKDNENLKMFAYQVRHHFKSIGLKEQFDRLPEAYIVSINNQIPVLTDVNNPNKSENITGSIFENYNDKEVLKDIHSVYIKDRKLFCEFIKTHQSPQVHIKDIEDESKSFIFSMKINLEKDEENKSIYVKDFHYIIDMLYNDLNVPNVPRALIILP